MTAPQRAWRTGDARLARRRRRPGTNVLPDGHAGHDMGERVCYLDFCPECDAEVAPDDDTCPDCGADLDDE